MTHLQALDHAEALLKMAAELVEHVELESHERTNEGLEIVQGHIRGALRALDKTVVGPLIAPAEAPTGAPDPALGVTQSQTAPNGAPR